MVPVDDERIIVLDKIPLTITAIARESFYFTDSKEIYGLLATSFYYQFDYVNLIKTFFNNERNGSLIGGKRDFDIDLNDLISKILKQSDIIFNHLDDLFLGIGTDLYVIDSFTDLGFDNVKIIFKERTKFVSPPKFYR